MAALQQAAPLAQQFTGLLGQTALQTNQQRQLLFTMLIQGLQDRIFADRQRKKRQKYESRKQRQQQTAGAASLLASAFLGGGGGVGSGSALGGSGTMAFNLRDAIPRTPGLI